MPARDPATGARRTVKRLLSAGSGRRPAPGLTILIFHRVGGGTWDELDLPADAFARFLEILDGSRVLALDDALDELERGDDTPKVALTFDDGFADVFEHAWPLLKERGLPFTLYLATAFIGGEMRWEGSAGQSQGHPALTWAQVEEMVSSGLCTFGNHTHDHAVPLALDASRIDECSAVIRARCGVEPRHFAFPWGMVVPAMDDVIRARFRSAVTGKLGRNHPGTDLHRLRRVPVRRSDPPEFFAAKMTGRLLPELAYASLVTGAKRLGRRG